MGGEPWLVRKPFFENPARVLQRFKRDILKATPDWPEIVISEVPINLPGWPYPTTACTVSALSNENLLRHFGKEQPDSSLNELDLRRALSGCWEDIQRGEGRFVVLYDEGLPREVCFFGYSFD
jgi:hypothetical protein